MPRSQTVLTIQDLRTQGKSVQEIAQELSISRTTVRKYLKHPEAVIRKPRPPRPSKLDSFKEQITTWVVERTVSHVKKTLWAGTQFTDLDDLNRQAHAWCERINARVHRTTHARPIDRLAEEQLLLLPQAFAWERFATEERKVTWDGYVSYDGVLYGLPGTLQLAGKTVQVRERKGMLTIWSQGSQVFEVAKRPRSQGSVPRPEQWKTVQASASVRRWPTPLGHLQPAPEVEIRSLSVYDQYCGIGPIQETFA